MKLPIVSSCFECQVTMDHEPRFVLTPQEGLAAWRRGIIERAIANAGGDGFPNVPDQPAATSESHQPAEADAASRASDGSGVRDRNCKPVVSPADTLFETPDGRFVVDMSLLDGDAIRKSAEIMYCTRPSQSVVKAVLDIPAAASPQPDAVPVSGSVASDGSALRGHEVGSRRI